MSAGRGSPLAWLPNAVTSGNLLLGFFSILASLRGLRAGAASGDFAVACWLILWATLGDVLDGKLAKLLHAGSEFGMYLDTFADAVTFGMAPAVLLYAAFLARPGGSPFQALAPLAYFLAACFRLARYNVQTQSGPRFGFVGVPTPTAAIIAATLYLSAARIAVAPEGVAALTALVALSMVSPFRYPALKGLKGREIGVVLVLLAATVGGALRWGTPPTVFVLFTTFALGWGLLWVPSRHLWVPGVRPGD